MQKFPFNISNCGKQLTGELYSETGVYAGGATRRQTSTTHYKNKPSKTTTTTWTTIDVRLASGKVRSITAKGDRYIAGGSPITLFYSSNGDRNLSAYYYNHSDDGLYKTTDKDRKSMRTDVLGWSPMRRFVALLADIATWLVGGLIALAIAVWTNTTWDWGWLACFTFFIALVGATLGLAVPAKWIGGGLWVHNSLEGELEQALCQRAKEIEIEVANRNNGASQAQFISGNELEGGLGDASVTPSTDSDAGFKPML